MPATVDFIPFATAGGANVEDQADYAADPQTAEGWTDGSTANSAKCNKSWRQACFMAAVLANFIASATGADVLDDGDLNGKVALLQQSLRYRVSNNLTVHISPSGSDSTGTGTSGNPWQTLNHAYAVLASQYDGNGFACAINLANGTYGAGLTVLIPLVGFTSCTVIGNGGSANATIAVTNGIGIQAIQGVNIVLTGLTISGSGSGSGQGRGIAASTGAVITVSTDVKFGACGVAAAEWTNSGSIIFTAAVSFNGNAPNILYGHDGGVCQFFGTFTVSCNSITVTQFLNLTDTSVLTAPNTITWSGGTGITGSKYFIDSNAVANIAGGTLPGSTGGTNGGHGAAVIF